MAGYVTQTLCHSLPKPCQPLCVTHSTYFEPQATVILHQSEGRTDILQFMEHVNDHFHYQVQKKDTVIKQIH
jgi:hypothetical protein